MAAHLFNESGQMQEVDIPDIFDVLEAGEDENAVKYLLGFGATEEGGNAAATATAGTSGGSAAVQVQPAAGTAVLPPNIKDIVARAGNPLPTVSTSVQQQSPSAISPGGTVEIDPKTGEEVRRGPGGRLVRKRDTSGMKAIYACRSCGKAFTTKFNLRRHINLHCNPSKGLGLPKEGPPSALVVNKKPTKAERLLQQQQQMAKAPPVAATAAVSVAPAPPAVVVQQQPVSVSVPGLPLPVTVKPEPQAPRPAATVVAQAPPQIQIVQPANSRVQVPTTSSNLISVSSSSSSVSPISSNNLPASSGLIITATTAATGLRLDDGQDAAGYGRRGGVRGRRR